MAKVVDNKTDKGIEIEDDAENGSSIRDACEELGVPFGCQNGICGTCMIDVIEGKENLTELTEAEEDLERDEEHRLACQCKLREGELRFEF